MTIPMIQLSNGVQMPQEGFGVFQIPEADCEQVVRDAIASGYRLIDTASSYQNEAAVGRAIAGCGVPREELFITTKAYIHEMGYENTMQAFNRSLTALGLDHADELALMRTLGVQPQAWAPFAEGLHGMFDEPVLVEIARKHGKTPAQIILRWNVEQGVIVIPKSLHKNRMEENLAIWDFALDADDASQITALDKNKPSMLDTRDVAEIRRVYDFLNNPVVTTLE